MNVSKRKFKISLAFLFIVLAFVGCSKKVEEADIVKMGFIPAESSEKVSSNGKVLSEILGKATGLKFQTYVASDYTALVEAMRSGQVHIGWLAPFAYVLAEKNADARVLLKSVRHGNSDQYSAIFVLSSSPYKTIQDLKGKNIAWTDPSSSTGHILPKSSLIAVGIDPDHFFAKQSWAGSHESAVMAVMNGSVDAAASFCDNKEGSSGSWTKYVKSLGDKAKPMRAIFVTPPMPTDTVSASGKYYNAHPDRVLKIKEALKNLNQSPEGREALKNLYTIEGLVDARNEEYEPLRKAAEKLGYSLGDKKKN